MKMAVIPVVIGARGTIPKGMMKYLEETEIRGQLENIQITAHLISVRILRRVLDTSNERLSANVSGKNSQRSK